MNGLIRKMKTRLDAEVQYQLPLSDECVDLNPLIGRTIKLVHTGHIECVHCHKAIKKTYNQGFCYPCFKVLAQCDLCIMKPEICHYAKGTCRDMSWADEFCFQPHYVYLANASGIKVGITRHTQIPTRWIDQGAVQALPIFKVSSRLLSGLLERVIAKHISDKTQWQKMLKAVPESIDLIAKRNELLSECAEDIQQIIAVNVGATIELLTAADCVEIKYPVLQYPSKVKSFNFAKTAVVEGLLQGIKGQYLVLDTGVINIRKFTGYEVEFSDR